MMARAHPLRRPVGDFGDRLAADDLLEDRAYLAGHVRRYVADVRQLHAAAGPHLVVSGSLALEDLADDLVVGLVEVEAQRDGQVLRGEVPLLRVERREEYRLRGRLDGLDHTGEPEVDEDDDEIRPGGDLGRGRLPRFDGVA